jgi:predicted transcriptional regulator
VSTDSTAPRKVVRIERTLRYVLFVDMESYQVDGRQMTETEIRDYELNKNEDKSDSVQDIYESVPFADQNTVETTSRVTFEEVAGDEPQPTA